VKAEDKAVRSKDYERQKRVWLDEAILMVGRGDVDVGRGDHRVRSQSREGASQGPLPSL
jgi:hypothetical protein